MKETYRREDDRTGFDETTNYLTVTLGKLVPTALARRAVAIDVETDRTTYRQGEPVEVTVTLRNRLPVPVEVPTPTRRRWSWTVDGVIEATEESRYVQENAFSLAFRAREKKTARVVWNGCIRRSGPDGLDSDEPVSRGEHTIEAFVAIGEPGDRPEAATTVRIE